MIERKAYLGGGIHVAVDREDGLFVLTTESGDGRPEPSNTIYLELGTIEALNQYITKVTGSPA